MTYRNINLLIAVFCLLGLGTQAQNFTSKSDLQYYRQPGQDGSGIFEPKKKDTTEFDGLKVRLGGDFALQFQGLDHSNDALATYNADSINTNRLADMGPNFNTPTANLNIDAQLDDGIRLSLSTYLSSRHHSDAWVKGGYLQIDKLSFLNSDGIDKLMNHMRVKVGHMEINYGDAHFRRTDNGNALKNPFVGNYIIDAFTTEMGGEIYGFYQNFLLMGAVTNGEIKGGVTNTDPVNPSYYGKVGYDDQLTNDFRLRLTGSFYTTSGSANNTLYHGDRAGSRYYSVMDNTLSSNDWSGRFSPSFNYKVTAYAVNPFIKIHGLEIFGNLEWMDGSTFSETSTRNWSQYGGEVLYRFGKEENFYLGGRYQTAQGALPFSETDVSIQRIQATAGLFITDNILAKLEYVDQQYNGFADTDQLSGGKFQGLMLEGAISF